MKKYLVLILLFSCIKAVCGQDNGSIKTFADTASTIFKQVSDSIRTKRIDKIFNDKILMFPNAFSKLMESDFSKIQTGTRVENIASSFAAISLDKDKQTFSLSQQVKSINGRHRFAIKADGELNGKSVFNFEDRNKVRLGISYTFLNTNAGYAEKPAKVQYERLYDIVIKEINDQLSAQKLDGVPIYNEKNDKDYEKEFKKNITNKLNAELDKREIAFLNKKWVRKSFYWFTINVNPLNNDNFRYIIKDDTSSYSSPYRKSINVPQVLLSFNYYREGSAWILNPSMNLTGSYKHNLSEVHSTKEWNRISQVNTEVHLKEETAKVYVLDNSDFHQLLLLDVGLRMLAINKNWQLGAEVAINNTKFITPGSKNSVSTINDISIGIVLPLTNSEGKKTINIMPFWAYRQYINYDKAIDNNFGVRFNIPFGL